MSKFFTVLFALAIVVVGGIAVAITVAPIFTALLNALPF